MSSLVEVNSLLDTKRAAVQQRIGERRGLEKRISDMESEYAELKLDSATTEKAVWVLQQYAEVQQKEIIDKIENVVTSGLQAVFKNETLQFKLYYSETKSGSKKKASEITMAVFYDYAGEQVKGDIRNSFGGGLAVVVATLLRVVIVMLLGKKVRRILVLDEPLKDLSPEYPDQDSSSSGYRDRMAEFLRGLTTETDLQLIIVSHEPNYSEAADIDYRFHGSIGKSPKITKKLRQELDGGM